MSYIGSSPKLKRTRYIPQSSDPVNPTEGDVQYSDGTVRPAGLWQYKSGSWSLIGSSNSSIQYISNPNADANTAGWATYADAAQASPVDGTGGTANITWTRNTTTPLRGIADFILTKDAANRQGQGVSTDFSIDSADRASVLRISFDYTISSGTYSGGTSSTDSDVTVWIYDVTNSLIIQPAVYKIDGAVSGQKYHFSSEFQASSNSSSYRLILHCSTTSASAFVLEADNFNIGPNVRQLGSVITEWISFTPTGSFVTNATYTGKWRRVGDQMEMNVRIAFSGTTTATDLSINLPSGYSIDTSKINSSSANTGIMAYGRALDSGVGNYVLSAAYSSTTAVSITYNGTVNNGFVNATNPFTFGSGGGTDEIDMMIRVPILGWGAVATLGQDSDTRVVAMQATSSTSSLSNAATTVIVNPTVVVDTHGAYNSSTGVYTVPVSGIYLVSAAFDDSGAAILVNETADLVLYKNGSSHKRLCLLQGQTTVGSLEIFVSGSSMVQCNAGDTLEIRLGNLTGETLVGNGNSTFNYINISRVSGPAQVQASELVAAKISGDPASASSGNPIIFPTTSFDTHASYNISTGRYTAPAAGIYRVYGYITSANSSVELNIYKNAVSDTKVGSTDSNGECSYAGSIKLVAGDIIDIRPNNTLDAASGSTICIERLGGL